MPSSKDDGITPESTPSPPAISAGLSRISLALRALLFAVTAASIAVMVTSKQTKEIISLPPFPPLVLVAKFVYSPSFIYFVAATSVACFYSLVSAVGTAALLRWRNSATSGTMSLLLAFFDALILGIVASATGAGASIGYVGARGNSHVGWIKICNMFDKFCWHVGGSLVLSAVASVILVLLTMLSTYSLHRRAR